MGRLIFSTYIERLYALRGRKRDAVLKAQGSILGSGAALPYSNGHYKCLIGI